jgi:lysozyme
VTLGHLSGPLVLGEAWAGDLAAQAYNHAEIQSGALSVDQQSLLVEIGTRSLQKAKGLTVNGMAGPKTRAALDSSSGGDGGGVPGIDVSHYQHKIEWPAVASEYAFAFMRASQGEHISDSCFAANWAGARAAGMIRGAYHCLEAAPDPVAQARHFAAAVQAAGGLLDGDLPPALDVEAIGHAFPSLRTVQACLDEIEHLLGRVPIVYIQGWYYKDVLGGAPQLHRYPLWVAGAKHSYEGWAPRFWQYGFAHVAGISGKVDADRFEGTLAELQALTHR